MALIYEIPPASNFFTPAARFDAIFNNPTVNRYDFGKAANTNINFQAIKGKHLYLIEKRSFSASMEEGVYLKNVVTQPEIRLSIQEQQNVSIYSSPLPMINYVDPVEGLVWAYAEQDGFIDVSFSGVLSQSAELVGVVTVFAQFTADIYEIRNKKWIENFFSRTDRGQGHNLIGLK